jgi:hypothetical protein
MLYVGLDIHDKPQPDHRQADAGQELVGAPDCTARVNRTRIQGIP